MFRTMLPGLPKLRGLRGPRARPQAATPGVAPWLARSPQHLPPFALGKLRRANRFANEAAIRRLCSTVSVAEHTVLCRVLGRYKMFVDTTDVGLASHLMLDGFWEMWVTEAMLGFVRTGMTAVFDRGAVIHELERPQGWAPGAFGDVLTPDVMERPHPDRWGYRNP